MCVYTNTDERAFITIAEILDGSSVRIIEDMSGLIGDIDASGRIIEGTRLFVYGQDVDDFIYIKKDAIWTVATAALQELDRQFQAEKTRNDTLEARLSLLESRLALLEN